MHQVVRFNHPTDARNGQPAIITNILYSMDGPRVYWLRFVDGSKFRANIAHISSYWAEVVSDDTGEVVQYHESRGEVVLENV
jgi:hypothetical protein